MTALAACLIAVASTWAESTDSVRPRRNIFRQFLDYLDDANKPKVQKAFDFSVIGGPHYSSDKGFGVGLVAAGQYRIDRTDTVMQPSSVSLYGNATTGLCFNVGIEGATFFPHDRMRLNYNVEFESFKTYFWGIGYQMNKDDANKTSYQYLKLLAKADFGVRIAKGLYLGPLMKASYIKGRRFERPEMWEGLPRNTFNLGFGVGFSLKYDTRDVVTNPYQGVYVSLEQTFCPKFLANRHPFSATDLSAAYYAGVWKDGVIASKIDANFTYGHTPWTMLPTFGGSNDMRGYYEGRYRDKCALTLCVELRQYVWRRFGFVAWGGAGKVFPSLKDFKLNHILPNYGVGLRWEFKKRVNVRLDYGFGRGCSGFVFSINEAF